MSAFLGKFVEGGRGRDEKGKWGVGERQGLGGGGVFPWRDGGGEGRNGGGEERGRRGRMGEK